MDSKKSITVFMIICLLVGAAFVVTNQGVAQARSLAEGDGITVPFNWTLTDSTGRATKDGVYAFTFELYDAKEGGKLLWSEQQSEVKVSKGKVSVELGAIVPFPRALLEKKDAQYWLAVAVRSSTEQTFTLLSPRQAMVLEPQSVNALSCPHNHFTDNWTGSSPDYGLRVQNTGTGDGIRIYTNTTEFSYAAIYALNQGNGGTAIYGKSTGTTGIGGYFESKGSDGLEGTTDASGHSGVYGHAANSYGVTGRSTNSFGLQAGGGGDSSIIDSVGDLLLDGQNGEIFANGSSGMSLYSNQDTRIFLDRDNNNVNELFSVYNGAGNNVFYVNKDGDIVATGDKTGYVVDVAQNDDSVSLETGDVVVISGAGDPILGEIPLIEVKLASAEGTSAVLGVVNKCFVTAEEHETGTTSNITGESCANETDIAPGEYLTVVTLGSFKAIKVDASFGAIHPGDLLVASSNPGYAMVDNDAKAGTIIGKALEGLESGTGTIAVLISFQ